jgi:LacI family transcriptional regulator, galactose operon repressor
MPIRMKDIAKDVGVSVMTVSKVIRNHPDIGEDTRVRVLKRIRELNFTPNAAAQALVTGRSDVVALIVPDLVQPFFAEIAKGLRAALNRSYSLILSSSEEEPSLEQKEIEHLLALSVSNSLSGRDWELDEVPAVRDPTHAAQIGKGHGVSTGKGQRCVALQ